MGLNEGYIGRTQGSADPGARLWRQHKQRAQTLAQSLSPWTSPIPAVIRAEACVSLRVSDNVVELVVCRAHSRA